MSDNTHIYCEGCDEIQPIKKDVMGDEDISNCFTNATDILCSICNFIIATTYSIKGKIK